MNLYSFEAHRTWYLGLSGLEVGCERAVCVIRAVYLECIMHFIGKSSVTPASNNVPINYVRYSRPTCLQQTKCSSIHKSPDTHFPHDRLPTLVRSIQYDDTAAEYPRQDHEEI